MIFVYIYIGFSLVTFVLAWGLTLTLTYKLIKKHNLVKVGNADLPLTLFFEGFKMLVLSFVPIVNVILLFGVLFLGNRIESEVTTQVEEQLEEAGYINNTDVN